jgi:hypothetical protein
MPVRVRIGRRAVDCCSSGARLYHCHHYRLKASRECRYTLERQSADWLLDRADSASSHPFNLNGFSIVLSQAAPCAASGSKSFDRIFGWNCHFNREHVLIGLAKECARQGSIIGRRWTPPAWAESEDVPPLLWHEAQEVILGDASYAADLLLLAGACDPERKSFRAARLARYFPPAMKERVAEIRSAPETLRLQRAGWLPSTCYDEHSDRAAEDVRALFAE